MAKKECVANRSSDDVTYFYVVDADPQNIMEPPTGDGYLCSDPIYMYSYYIFSTYDSISTWYNVDDTKAAG